MGAMVHGGSEGLFELSENTCLSGIPQERYLDANAKEYMRQARILLTEKKIDEAEALLNKCCGIKETYGTQVPMGRLFAGISESTDKVYRELELITGVCEDKLKYESFEIKRQSFISNPARIMCVKLSAGGVVLPQLRVWVEGWSQPSNTELQGRDLVVKGRALENIHSDGLRGVEYTIRLRMDTDGSVSWSRKGIMVDNATSLILYLTAATDMFYPDKEEYCKKLIDMTENMSYDKIYAEHCTEHSAWMNKCELTLPHNSASGLPIDKRIIEYRNDRKRQLKLHCAVGLEKMQRILFLQIGQVHF